MKSSVIAYAAIQSTHNIAGALTLAIALHPAWLAAGSAKTGRALWFLFFVWGIQGATGASFALASLYFYGALPDIRNVAIAAMAVKVACVIAACSFSGWLLYNKGGVRHWYVRLVFIALSLTALVAAAILRWTS